MGRLCTGCRILHNYVRHGLLCYSFGLCCRLFCNIGSRNLTPCRHGSIQSRWFHQQSFQRYSWYSCQIETIALSAATLSPSLPFIRALTHLPIGFFKNICRHTSFMLWLHRSWRLQLLYYFKYQNCPILINTNFIQFFT